MASPALESKIQTLNAKMEGQAKTTIDEMDKLLLRPIARSSYTCVVSCYDKSGKTGSTEELQRCASQCQLPYQQAQNVVSTEVNQFQNRLSRAMMSCQDEARDYMSPEVRTLVVKKFVISVLHARLIKEFSGLNRE
uniref:Uncharacterized protein n=1 Tax=Proboscia inermis TaxID=420281 RepID=A0A7S0CHI7_9STRA|mmetsp:Transcript_48385/g.48725  ORF Transcript_48385/g.48725 Transcript_48385/m.48725 type:complete len:136 (+) Transcript_48385:71-478(+)